jgi:uncharacterized protein YegP (UPF0339 family)
MAVKIEFYEDEKGESRWRVKASNGQIIGAATEGYLRKEHASNNLKALLIYANETNIRIASEGMDQRTDPENDNLPVEFYKDNADEWRWRVTARNGSIVHAASEGYTSLAGAKTNLEKLVETVAEWDRPGT